MRGGPNLWVSMATRVDQTATSDGDESCSAVRRWDARRTWNLSLKHLSSDTGRHFNGLLLREWRVLPRNAIERQMDWEGAQDFTGKKKTIQKCLQTDIWGKRYYWLIMKKTATSVCVFSILGEHLYTHFPYFANKRHLLPELFICILSHILLILVCLPAWEKQILKQLMYLLCTLQYNAMSSVKTNPKWPTV